jgi:hypothetical protein
MDWGSVPDWLAGTGSVAALLFAFYAVREARRTNAQQSEQLGHVLAERRRAQAAKISGWVVETASGERQIRISNGSELPVFAMVAFCGLYDCELDPDPTRTVHHAVWCQYRQRSVPPGTTTFRLPPNPDVPNLQAERTDSYFVALVFRDGDGTVWLRDSYGRLTTEGAADYLSIEGAGWRSERDIPILARLDQRS